MDNIVAVCIEFVRKQTPQEFTFILSENSCASLGLVLKVVEYKITVAVRDAGE